MGSEERQRAKTRVLMGAMPGLQLVEAVHGLGLPHVGEREPEERLLVLPVMRAAHEQPDRPRELPRWKARRPSSKSLRPPWGVLRKLYVPLAGSKVSFWRKA